MSAINQAIKKLFRKFGVDIIRFNPYTSSSAQIIASLHKFNIDLIMDVGANEGQFSLDIRSAGYKENIISFEPLSIAHEKLCSASLLDPKWAVYSRCAVGNATAEMEINIASNSTSSSLLPMLDSHISAAPHSSYINKEKVSMLTLDSICKEYIKKYKNIFLKIDTQGFEWQVLDGAKDLLPHVRGLLIELSLVELYKDQRLWEETISRLKKNGFELWSIQPGFVDPRNGQTLQLDGIFYRLRP